MSLFDWIYPPKCIACRMLLPLVHNAPRQWLCQECEQLFTPIDEPFCRICGHPGDPCVSCNGKSFYFESHRALFTYEDTVRDLIHHIKFQSKKQAALGLGNMLAEHVKDWGLSGEYIIPVPLHPSKKRDRGFNQATVLAGPLSKALGIPISENMLKRVKKTTPQNLLSSHAREENLVGAFLYNERKFKSPPEAVILIDDIFTSGATMNACAEILKVNGVGKVYCLSVSIALKGD